MKLSVWAKQNGLSYKTAYRMFYNGTLPVPAEQFATGTIIVHPPEKVKPGKTVLYGRVSSRDQQDDLDRQLVRLREFAAAKGISVQQEIAEIASGFRDKRPKLHQILRDPTITTIVVEHRDRLARFGVKTLEAALEASKRRIIVMNETDLRDDLVHDFADVVTAMCNRIYGKRSAKNRARKALKAADES